MKYKDLAIIGFIMIVGALIGYLWLAPAGYTPAPQARFTDLHGKAFNLSDLKGKAVIVNFWATECPACVNEIPLLNHMYQQYSHQGLLVIGVAMSYDPQTQVREMVKQKAMSYPIVLDSQDKLRDAFHVNVTPTTIFIDKEGKIVKRKLGEMLQTELETGIQTLIH